MYGSESRRTDGSESRRTALRAGWRLRELMNDSESQGTAHRAGGRLWKPSNGSESRRTAPRAGVRLWEPTDGSQSRRTAPIAEERLQYGVRSTRQTSHRHVTMTTSHSKTAKNSSRKPHDVVRSVWRVAAASVSHTFSRNLETRRRGVESLGNGSLLPITDVRRFMMRGALWAGDLY